jgi:hypothetical protein
MAQATHDEDLLSVETLNGLRYVPHLRGITPMHIVAVGAPAIPAIIFSFVIPVLPYQVVLLFFVAAFVFMVVFQWNRPPSYWIRVFQRGDLPPSIYRVLSSPLFGLSIKRSAPHLTPFDKGHPHTAMGLPYLDLRRHGHTGERG